MILLRPTHVLEYYAHSQIAIQNSLALAELRLAFNCFDPQQYRGTSRFPLSPYPSLDAKVIEEFRKSGLDMQTDARARHRFCEITGEAGADDDDFDYDLLSNAADAMEVMSLVDDPDKWEIIRVSRLSESRHGALGFDIAYWGGDHFSLIADTIVIPTWHPPDSKDFMALREALSSLNACLLFDSAQAAEDFKTYYKSRPWAETEATDGEFCIIRVEAVT